MKITSNHKFVQITEFRKFIQFCKFRKSTQPPTKVTHFSSDESRRNYSRVNFLPNHPSLLWWTNLLSEFAGPPLILLNRAVVREDVSRQYQENAKWAHANQIREIMFIFPHLWLGDWWFLRFGGRQDSKTSRNGCAADCRGPTSVMLKFNVK